MPADVLIPLPDGVSDRAASTLMMKGMTAQYLFRQVYPLKGGETILYHAAAGGVGLIACQWARAIGVTMIGTVSTDEKAAIARANGCTHTIVTWREDIAKRVRETHRRQGRAGGLRLRRQGHPDGLARQPAAARHAGQQRHHLRAGGHRHHVARRQGLDLGHATGNDSLRRRRARTCWPWPRSCSATCWPARIDGEPKQQFALADAADAHRALESRQTTGATVLVP